MNNKLSLTKPISPFIKRNTFILALNHTTTILFKRGCNCCFYQQ